MEETRDRMAAAYARATTNTRCANLPDCAKCGVRYCDYKSRYEAYRQGWADAVRTMTGLRP